MRLLFVTDDIPYPLDRGSHIRIHNLLMACAEDFEVTLLAPRSAEQPGVQLPVGVKSAIYFDPDKPIPFSFRRLVKALRLQVGFSFGRDLRFRLRMLHALEKLDLDSFELIFAERPVVGVLFKEQSRRTVVDFDDLEHRKILRRMRAQPGARAWLHDLYRLVVFRHTERHRFGDYLQVLVCSREDQQALRCAGVGNAGIVGNGTQIPVRPSSLRVRAAANPCGCVSWPHGQSSEHRCS